MEPVELLVSAGVPAPRLVETPTDIVSAETG
jgi:hypothetical protein